MSLLLEIIQSVARQKMRDAKLGKNQSSSTKQKISRAMKGKKNHKGEKHSLTSRLRIKRERRKNGDQGEIGGTKWYKPSAYTSSKPDKRKKIRPQGYVHGRSNV